MSLSSIKQAAARSVSRQKKRKEVSPPPPETPSPEGVVKTTATGKRYRLYTIPLSDLPAFLERERFEAKTYFRYAPEVKLDKDGREIPFSGNVLGVRRKGEKDVREL